MQTGSAFILIASFFGATPSSETTPFTLPACDLSTFWPDGVPAGAEASPDLFEVSWLPPHAVSSVASATVTLPTQTLRRRIEYSLKALGSQLSALGCDQLSAAISSQL